MMNTEVKHTPEPWDYTLIPDPLTAGCTLLTMADQPFDQMIMIQCVPNEEAEMAEENFRRAKAAVNSCKGISTEALEGNVIPETIAGLHSIRKFLRDEGYGHRDLDRLLSKLEGRA